MKRRVTVALTLGRKGGEGAERGATQSEARQLSLSSPPGRKVIDRNAIVEALSQLRDTLDRYLEEVNDLAMRNPSMPVARSYEEEYDEVPWPSDDEAP